MITVEKLTHILRRFNQQYCCVNRVEDLSTYYPKIGNKNIKYMGLCGLAANEFQKILIDRHKIKTEYIGIYYKPIISPISNRKIVEDFEKCTGYISELESADVLSTYRNTHVVLEVSRGNGKIIIDPTCGIVYNYSKEQLMRGFGSVSSSDIAFLKRSIHRDHMTYYFLTKRFWTSVYYFNYANMLGDDITQYGEYNKYTEDICW